MYVPMGDLMWSNFLADLGSGKRLTSGFLNVPQLLEPKVGGCLCAELALLALWVKSICLALDAEVGCLGLRYRPGLAGVTGVISVFFRMDGPGRDGFLLFSCSWACFCCCITFMP
uniref:(northern house mosquito) hypothetical protein n=1 Tax=Culex pipiens TaxID=7175 RepID=A0A8D7ZUD4_CULPI